MDDKFNNIDQLFGSLKNQEINEPLSTNEWSGIQSKMLLRNFMKFNAGSFNIFYATILTIGAAYGIYSISSDSNVSTTNSIEVVNDSNFQKQEESPTENATSIPLTKESNQELIDESNSSSPKSLKDKQHSITESAIVSSPEINKRVSKELKKELPEELPINNSSSISDELSPSNELVKSLDIDTTITEEVPLTTIIKNKVINDTTILKVQRGNEKKKGKRRKNK